MAQCVICAAPLVGHQTRFCSKRCNRRQHKPQENARRKAVIRFVCIVCGKRFGSMGKTAKYCSSKCHAQALAERNRIPGSKADRRRRRGRLFTAGTCKRCGLAFVSLRTQDSFCSRKCNDREAHDRRRARKHAVYYEPINRRRVFERDRWRCGICGRRVRRQAKVPHPMAPVIDHVVPLACGGEHSERNAQCAHFLCNSLKAADPLMQGEQLRLLA